MGRVQREILLKETQVEKNVKIERVKGEEERKRSRGENKRNERLAGSQASITVFRFNAANGTLCPPAPLFHRSYYGGP